MTTTSLVPFPQEVPVSTLSLSPSFAPVRSTRRARSSVRLTRRGRVSAVLSFLLLALVLTTALGGWAAATHHSGGAEPVRVVTVQPGDTLYDIAGRTAGPGEVRAMVHRIQQLNSLPSGSLQVGQQIAVPR